MSTRTGPATRPTAQDEEAQCGGPDVVRRNALEGLVGGQQSELFPFSPEHARPHFLHQRIIRPGNLQVVRVEPLRLVIIILQRAPDGRGFQPVSPEVALHQILIKRQHLDLADLHDDFFLRHQSGARAIRTFFAPQREPVIVAERGSHASHPRQNHATEHRTVATNVVSRAPNPPTALLATPNALSVVSFTQSLRLPRKATNTSRNSPRGWASPIRTRSAGMSVCKTLP